MPAIANSKILIMATHGFEESELLKPLEELKANGATMHVASRQDRRGGGGGTAQAPLPNAAVRAQSATQPVTFR